MIHLTRGGNNLHFFYDAQNKPAVVLYDGVAYAYMYNLQGDVIAIVNASGTKVVEYRYDAWGKPISKTGSMATTLGTLNPFRYRGYVYDEETGLYYLRSRYYNPEWGRFVNADALYNNGSTLLNHNRFAYCTNMPVLSYDPSGLIRLFSRICLIDDSGDTSNDFSTFALPLSQGPFLQEGRKGSAKLDRISRSYLLSSLDEIIRMGDWNYHKGSMKWGNVDCVGITRIIVQQQSQTLCRSLPTTAEGMRKLCGLENETTNQIVDGNTLVPGMAVFTYDPNHFNGSGKRVPWYHMGVYVGNYVHPVTGEYIGNAVIQAASAKSGIIVSSLSETSFTNYAYMPFVDYQ